MAQQTHSRSTDQRLPIANCICCKIGMRLTIIDTATRPGVDTLVFECTCGFSIKCQCAERIHRPRISHEHTRKPLENDREGHPTFAKDAA
jgi:hypothetical protein